MPLIETEGLILKSYGLSEADKLVYCFTRQRGMIKAVARNARRPRNRFGGCLEPFTVAELAFFEKEECELVSIRHADLLYSGFSSTADLEVLKTFSYFAELLLEFAPPGEPDEILYRMAKVAFPAVTKDHIANKYLTLYFEVWILKLSGFMPDWNVCGECRKNNAAGESLVFDAGFRFYCLSCRFGKNNLLSAADLRVLSLTSKLAPPDFIEKMVAENYQTEILTDLTRRIIRRTLEREPKTWSYTV